MKRLWQPLICLSLLGISGPTTAQEAQPASAIPWLTDSLQAPPETPSNQEQTSTEIEKISVQKLSQNDRDGLGILTKDLTGLPFELWSGLSAIKVQRLIRETPYAGVPAIRGLYRQVLLAETAVPDRVLEQDSVLLTRIDRLLEIGALSEAQALIELVGPDTSDLFRRWFDIGLLTNQADQACAELDRSPMLSPARNVRVFCLALSRDWDAAATSLALGEELGEISVEDADLLAFFLDESLLEEIEPPEIGSPLTSLEFVIREFIGLPRPTSGLPIAFMHAELAEFVPLRYRIEAAEMLVREGVLPANVLFAAYREEEPAASGGVWERMAATQSMDSAATAEEISEALFKLDREFSKAGLRLAAAEAFLLYFSELPHAEFSAETRDTIALYFMLADAPELALAWASDTPAKPLKTALSVASKRFDGTTQIEAVLSSSTPEAFLSDYQAGVVSRGQIGEAIFAAIALLSRDENVDEDDLIQALALLRATAQEEVATQLALQTLLLPLEKPHAN